MLHLICNIIKNLIHTEEKPYDKSVHTGEEPYIYGFIIVSLINNLVNKNNSLSNLLIVPTQPIVTSLLEKWSAMLLVKNQ